MFLVALHISNVLGFLQGYDERLIANRQVAILRGELSNTLQTNKQLEIGRYRHKSFNLTYLYKEAAAGREKDPPIILM